MAQPRNLIAPLSRIANTSIALLRHEIPRFVPVTYQSRRGAARSAETKKKKQKADYKQYDLKMVDQFTLIDAMHYLRSFEVGRDPTSVKYEMHVKLRTQKNGPVVRNRLRLPHALKTGNKFCVIAPPGSKAAAAARAAGASLVGEDEVFAQIRDGTISFDRCICHADSLQKLNKSGVARILGPRGLMPSVKMGTVVTDVAATLRDMMGASEYRERQGVVRMAVGQLAFTPAQMRDNIKAFMDSVKRDTAQISERYTKDVHEVVLSSTNGPGFSLNGEFRTPYSVDPLVLAGPL